MTEEQYIILKHDKSVEHISKKKAEFITQAMAQGARGVRRDDGIGWLPFSTIADICSLTEFYAKYPDKRPELERTPEQLAKEREYYKPIQYTASKRQRAFKGMLEGMKKFIDDQTAMGQKPLNAIRDYQAQLAKYVRLFGGEDKRTDLEKVAEDFGGEVID